MDFSFEHTFYEIAALILSTLGDQVVPAIMLSTCMITYSHHLYRIFEP